MTSTWLLRMMGSGEGMPADHSLRAHDSKTRPSVGHTCTLMITKWPTKSTSPLSSSTMNRRLACLPCMAEACMVLRDMAAHLLRFRISFSAQSFTILRGLLRQ